MDAGTGSARLVEAGTCSWRSILLRRAALGLAALLVATLALAARADAFVYWTNFNGTIGRANLDGTGVDQSFITGASRPTGVAVDKAAPSQPGDCGETITADTTLHRDLV